jgi:CNT family concentrative nucleoside transporter
LSKEPTPPPTPLAWRILIAVGVLTLTCAAYLGRDLIGVRGQSALGVVCFLGVAAMCSADLRAVRWRALAAGFALQVLLGLFVLRFEVFGVRPGYAFFALIGDIVARFLTFSGEGAEFVFGKLADPGTMRGVLGEKNGFVFAFVALPTIIFVSSFFAVLYHLRILPLIVRFLARVMRFVMGTSGAETLAAAANVFMGQTEAPLIIKPYIERMTRSELLALMAGGMATVSGGMLAVYIELGADRVATLVTCVMAAPCSLYLAKLVLPETEVPLTHGSVREAMLSPHRNVIDAASSGASDGMKLALNVAAMLIAFLAFIALFNAILTAIRPDWTLQRLFAWAFSPCAVLIGVEPGDVPAVADLLGIKLVANELVAYTRFFESYRDALSERSRVLATFALTGFANFASVGIQIGGIGAIAPSRRADLAGLGGRALLCGFLATLVNAALAGLLL